MRPTTVTIMDIYRKPSGAFATEGISAAADPLIERILAKHETLYTEQN
jgi:hypothetical protein